MPHAATDSLIHIAPSSSADSTTGNVWELDTQRPLWQRMFSFPFWRACWVPPQPQDEDNHRRSRPQTRQKARVRDDNVDVPKDCQHCNQRDSPMTDSLSASDSDLTEQHASDAQEQPTYGARPTPILGEMEREQDANAYDSDSLASSHTGFYPGPASSRLPSSASRKVVPLPPPPPPPPLPPSFDDKAASLLLQQAAQRPPRASLRASSCTTGAHTLVGTSPVWTSKSPVVTRPESNRVRALSTCSTNSRHRRANVEVSLPPMQSLVGDDTELDATSVIPVVTIDPAKCRRQISAWEDDDVFNLSSDSEDETDRPYPTRDDDESYGSDDGASPTSVVHSRSNKTNPGTKNAASIPLPPPLTSPTTVAGSSATLTPNWMHAWAVGEVKTCVSPETINEVKSSPAVDAPGEDPAVSPGRYTITYLPLEPRFSANLDAEVIFTGGWVCAYGNGLGKDIQAIEATASASLYYLQLLDGGILQLLPSTGESKSALELPLTTRDSVQVVPASPMSSHQRVGGCCLSIESLSINLWPVPVPEGMTSVPDLVRHYNLYQGNQSDRKATATTLSHLDVSLHAKEDPVPQNDNPLPAMVSDDEDEVSLDTPQAQHDAVLHLRFGLDAALRSAFPRL